jgi:hypothetical protein
MVPVDDRSTVVVSNSAALLLRLLTSPEGFVLTNKSMAIIVDNVSKSLLEQIQRGKERELFEYWEGQVAAFSRRLRTHASEATARLPHGSQLPLVTEDVVIRTFRECFPKPEFP